MDFIEGLPKSQGKEVILVVIDRLSKYAHSMALSHPFSAIKVAQVYMDQVYKLHGSPKSIVSDRDKIFISNFWSELMKLQGVKQKMSSAYHPQTDGQSEVLNRCVEGYLRCMCHEKPLEWSKWLPLAEFWYNSNFHTAIQKTLFEVVYGIPPPIHRPYIQGSTAVEAVDRSLQQREQTIAILKHNLCKAQNRMQQLANRKRSERSFEEGEWVYLKLQPYRQSTVGNRPYHKLATKYFGPYQVIKKIGEVAYSLKLPAHSKIHSTFHVSLLKKHQGPVPAVLDDSIPQTYDSDSLVTKEPQKVLEIRSIKRNNVAVVQWLVQWENCSVEESTWEDASVIMHKFSQFDPWGQGSSHGGGIDTMWAIMKGELEELSRSRKQKRARENVDKDNDMASDMQKSG